MKLTIDQALKKAVEAHKSGQIQEADRLYTAILKAQPKHPDANHNLGVLAVNVGKVQKAVPFLTTALEANPSIAQFWISYIDALIKLDRYADAKAAFDLAKNKGAQDGDFEKLRKRLKDLDGSSIGTISKVQSPPHDRIQTLINLYGEGQLHQALEQAETLLKEFPRSALLLNILGAVYKGLGQFDLSVDACSKALAIKPDYADAFYNMGVALQDQSKLDEAIEAYDKALAIKLDYAAAYNNMGVTLQDQGKLDEAVEAYKKGLAIKPDQADTHINMGVILQDQGKPDEAIETYLKALAIKPDHANAYYNMGNALQNQGKLAESIEAYYKALAIKPDYADAYYNMGIVLQGVTFKQPNLGLQKIISSLLDKKSLVRPKNIASSALSLLKMDPRLKRHLRTSSLTEVKPKLLEVIRDIYELPLLLQLMRVCPLPDLDIENLFREVRACLLLNILDLTGSPEELEFQSTLALQCFINEYIYNQSEHEDEAIASLEEAAKQILISGDQPSPQSILCLASYKPLNQYQWSSLLLINDEIENVFTRQITEPNKEAKLKAGLPILGEITDEVSSKVRDQYEENPYPRWVNLALPPKPAPISKIIKEKRLKLFDEEIEDTKCPNILIAGCGTGQHSIGTAALFENCNVLAVDLSLSSLGYAKRKTEELGVKNIDYVQADILHLGKLGRQFDIVESAGVLHHMEDPMAGWRILTDCLKPGGLMKIGLYSELARQHIVEMRQEISKAGTGSSVAEMKSFREATIISKQNYHEKIYNSSDFYSLSEMRDLLFHVQEHRFTIPQLQDCLSNLGLQFCGFDAFKVISHFNLANTSPNDPYDLKKWHTYEATNPSAFMAMYQFWCQKTA